MDASILALGHDGTDEVWSGSHATVAMFFRARHLSCRQTDQKLKLILHPHGLGGDIMKVLHCPRPGLLIARDGCLDGADPNVNVPVRNTTITPLQALTLLNDPFMIAQAQAFAERLKREEPSDSKRIDLAFRYALGRSTTERERAAFVSYIRDHGSANACRLIFNLNEFLFVD